MSYSSIPWLALAVGLTALGAVLSYVAWRRNGVRSGLHWGAVALLPLAAYLTGAIEMLWKIGAAIGNFGTAFVFSPVKWAGIVVTALAIVLFVSTSGRQRRRAAREARRAAKSGRKPDAVQEQARTAAATGSIPVKPGITTGGSTAVQPVKPAQPAAKQSAPASKTQKGPGRQAAATPPHALDKDTEEILRNLGI